MLVKCYLQEQVAASGPRLLTTVVIEDTKYQCMNSFEETKIQFIFFLISLVIRHKGYLTTQDTVNKHELNTVG